VRRLIAPLALAGALAAPAAAAAEDVTVRMPGKFFEPARLTTVAGDRLTFRNNDLTTHDVKIGGGLFDSGPIGRFTQWSQPVEQPGEYPFVCTLHAFMSGNVSVVAATAKAAPQGALAGEPLTVSGRTRTGAGPLALERSVAGGAWEVVDPAVAVDAGGAYAARTPAVEGASYRVATPAGPGQVVTPSVTAKVEVAVMVHHGMLHVTAKGAPKGMVATLERYSRWHFRWRARRSRPIRDGAAMFMLGARRSYVRVALRRGADGPALVRSGVVKSWNGRPAQDPDSIVPPVAGHHGGGGDEDGSGGHGGH
jgi:plastocyanin